MTTVWGSLIAWYLFLAGAAAGAFATAAFVEAKYPGRVGVRKAGRVLAPVMMAVGLVMLMIDAEAGLHNPMRFFGLVMNPGSVMTLGVYVICGFMPVVIAAAALELLGRAVPKWLSVLGALLSFGVAAYTGFLLGVVEAYPLWNNAALPVLFAISAFSTGIAAATLGSLAFDRRGAEGLDQVKGIHFGLIVAELCVLLIMMLVMGSGSAAPAVRSILFGEFAALFWGAVVVVGLLVPLVIEGLHLFARNKARECGCGCGCGDAQVAKVSLTEIVAEVCVLIGGFSLRYLIVLAAVPVVFL